MHESGGMASTCHLCGSPAVGGDPTGATKGGFECADCGELTCNDCKSIGVGRDSDHCRRCRG
jgi:hypothetical protein